MRKLVSTSMSETMVTVTIQFLEGPSGQEFDFTPHAVEYEFPFSLVNPRIALQVATLLTSDPTVPQSITKCEGNCESKEE